MEENLIMTLSSAFSRLIAWGARSTSNQILTKNLKNDITNKSSLCQLFVVKCIST